MGDAMVTDEECRRIEAIQLAGVAERARVAAARLAFWGRMAALTPAERRARDVDAELNAVVAAAKVAT